MTALTALTALAKRANGWGWEAKGVLRGKTQYRAQNCDFGLVL